MEKDKGFLQNVYEKTLDVIQEVPGGRYMLGGIAALGVLMNSQNVSSEEIKSKIETVFVGIDRDDKTTVLVSDPNCRFDEETSSLTCKVEKTVSSRDPLTYKKIQITEEKELTMPLSQCQDIDDVTALMHLWNTKVVPNSGKECNFFNPERDQEVKKILHTRNKILSNIKQCTNEPECDYFAVVRSAIDPEHEDPNFKIELHKLTAPKCYEALKKIRQEKINRCPDLLISDKGNDTIELDLQSRP